jgi:hypothetical protein
MTTWNRAAQTGADADDFGYRLGTHIADSIMQFARLNDLKPSDIMEALPVLIVDLLSHSVRQNLPAGELWELLQPVVSEQIRAVDFGKSDRGVARR